MLLETILFIITFLLLIKLLTLNKKPIGTPPGTNGLPIVGVLPPRNVTFEQFINIYRKKYGDIFWIKMGAGNHVILSEYEDIISAFNNPSLQGKDHTFTLKLFFKNGEKDLKLRDFHVNYKLGIFSTVGEHWKNLRRFVIKSLREGGMGKSTMEDIILPESEALAKDFEQYLEQSINLPFTLDVSILNIIWKLVGGEHFDIFNEEMQHFCRCLNNSLVISQEKLFIFDAIPWLVDITPNFILNYFGKNDVENNMELVYKLIHKTIEEHRNTLDENNPRDLIDSYLIDIINVENDSRNKADYSETFSERELALIVFELLMAGGQSTSSTLKWIIFYFVKYPEIQKKVQEELDKVISKDKRISLADKENLPYLEACISETLRFKTIFPFGFFHIAIEDSKIRDYFIPKGTHILANFNACHKNPKFWVNPNKFDPEHFLNADGSFNNKKEGFLAFSTGRRHCIGEHMSRMSLYFNVATLMQRFTFTKVDPKEMEEERFTKQKFFAFTHDYRVIITKRK